MPGVAEFLVSYDEINHFIKSRMYKILLEIVEQSRAQPSKPGIILPHRLDPAFLDRFNG